jgi:hypothetical protein
MTDVTHQPRKGWAQASLRIFSDTVTVQWITERLGIQPDIGGNAGEPGGGTSVRRSTLWALKSGLTDEHPLNEHIQHLLGRLESRRDALAGVGEKCGMDIFAGAFADDGQMGETIPWQTLKALGQHSLDLTLDLYPPDAPGTQPA